MGVPENLELEQLGILLRQGVQLVTDAAGLVPGAEHVEAVHRHRGGLLGHSLALLVPRELHAHARGPQLRDLAAREHRLRPGARCRLLHAGQLDALGGLGDIAGCSLHRVLLEACGFLTPCCRRHEKRDRNRPDQSGELERPHKVLPRVSVHVLCTYTSGVPSRRLSKASVVHRRITRALRVRHGREDRRWKPSRPDLTIAAPTSAGGLGGRVTAAQYPQLPVGVKRITIAGD